jgi:hypothetical protein
MKGILKVRRGRDRQSRNQESTLPKRISSEDDPSYISIGRSLVLRSLLCIEGCFKTQYTRRVMALFGVTSHLASSESYAGLVWNYNVDVVILRVLQPGKGAYGVVILKSSSAELSIDVFAKKSSSIELPIDVFANYGSTSYPHSLQISIKDKNAEASDCEHYCKRMRYRIKLIYSYNDLIPIPHYTIRPHRALPSLLDLLSTSAWNFA